MKHASLLSLLSLLFIWISRFVIVPHSLCFWAIKIRSMDSFKLRKSVLNQNYLFNFDNLIYVQLINLIITHIKILNKNNKLKILIR